MRDFKGKIESLCDDFNEAAEQLQDQKSHQALRNEFLGRKKGHLTRLISEIQRLNSAEKKEAGQLINGLKQHILSVLDRIEEQNNKASISGVNSDLTLPGYSCYWGAPHPLIQMMLGIEGLLLKMGFSKCQGPEIEKDYYNFTGLNYPCFHSARTAKEALYIDDEYLMRTHIAAVFIRVMEKQRPPLRIITSGKTFRNHSSGEATSPIGLQVGGLVVDLGINFSHLKGLLEGFLKTLFNDRIKLRFRPKYIPYSEPGVEIDIGCPHCRGDKKTCPTCSATGWASVMAGGLIGPQILKNINIDPEKYAGFFFGMDVDRIAGMLAAGNKQHNYYENDLRLIRITPRIS